MKRRLRTNFVRSGGKTSSVVGFAIICGAYIMRTNEKRGGGRVYRSDLYGMIGYCKGCLVVTKRRLKRKINKIKRKILGIKNYLWYKIKLGGNEFDESLELDVEKMKGMDRAELDAYCAKVAKNRGVAHDLDMKGK